MLMNRGYADHNGTPVPDKAREQSSTMRSTLITQNWTPDEVTAYLAQKYGRKLVSQSGCTKTT